MDSVCIMYCDEDLFDAESVPIEFCQKDEYSQQLTHFFEMDEKQAVNEIQTTNYGTRKSRNSLTVTDLQNVQLIRQTSSFHEKSIITENGATVTLDTALLQEDLDGNWQIDLSTLVYLLKWKKVNSNIICNGETPLHKVIYRAYKSGLNSQAEKAIEMLVSHGADYFTFGTPSALNYAALLGQSRIVDVLLKFKQRNHTAELEAYELLFAVSTAENSVRKSLQLLQRCLDLKKSAYGTKNSNSYGLGELPSISCADDYLKLTPEEQLRLGVLSVLNYFQQIDTTAMPSTLSSSNSVMPSLLAKKFLQCAETRCLSSLQFSKYLMLLFDENCDNELISSEQYNDISLKEYGQIAFHFAKMQLSRKNRSLSGYLSNLLRQTASWRTIRQQISELTCLEKALILYGACDSMIVRQSSDIWTRDDTKYEECLIANLLNFATFVAFKGWHGGTTLDLVSGEKKFDKKIIEIMKQSLCCEKLHQGIVVPSLKCLSAKYLHFGKIPQEALEWRLHADHGIVVDLKTFVDYHAR